MSSSNTKFQGESEMASGASASLGLDHDYQEAELSKNMEKITEELEQLLKIQDLLNQPYKNRAFAIPKSWTDRFHSYASQLRDLHTDFSAKVLDHISFKADSNSTTKPSAINLNEECQTALAGLDQPTSVMNFDLVFLSPKYTEKMNSALDQNIQNYK